MKERIKESMGYIYHAITATSGESAITRMEGHGVHWVHCVHSIGCRSVTLKCILFCLHSIIKNKSNKQKSPRHNKIKLSIRENEKDKIEKNIPTLQQTFTMTNVMFIMCWNHFQKETSQTKNKNKQNTIQK